MLFSFGVIITTGYPSTLESLHPQFSSSVKIYVHLHICTCRYCIHNVLTSLATGQPRGLGFALDLFVYGGWRKERKEEAQVTPATTEKKERSASCTYLLYRFKIIIMCQMLCQENKSVMLLHMTCMKVGFRTPVCLLDMVPFSWLMWHFWEDM